MTVTTRRLTARHARATLLATTAFFALPGIAAAQTVSADRPTGVESIGYSIGAAPGVTSPVFADLHTVAQSDTPRPDIVENEPDIVIRQPGTPTTALDPTNVTGVGQMVIDQRNGFLGLCTGTLINPRTVLFAAHCVNENPAGTGAQDPWGYGAAQGGLPISFGFAANNLPAVRAWYLAGAGQYKTNTANFLYNVNQVVYNADSLKLGLANNFIQADIAIATLDTPAANVPTWALLLSALPAPAAISETTGTGYHVQLSGYGTNGVGTTGATGGIDYRRRLAENYIGLLGSFDDRDAFLFGSPSGLPQNLYQLDFDDPRRGTATASPFDFNLFKDNALPNEGTTAGGDSGGPLILDRAFAKQVVIGVLSGGSRFFGAQPFSTYGTESFYQPLYLFWDYIAANNPYRYAQTRAGDGAWTDAAHWVTALDPNYQIVQNGQLVNGVPTLTGAGIAGDGNKFGQVCFRNDCYDVRTGVETVNGVPVSGDEAAPSSAKAAVAADVDRTGMSAENTAQGGIVDAALITGGENAAQATGDAVAQAVAATPAPTLSNGLPGATNFVPNNIDPDRVTQRSARYYDVTLSAAGTTTLSSAVTVDKFTVAGSAARLAVTSAGSLTSLMSITQVTGTVQNDGVITTPGDYFVMNGLLSGSGRINAPFFTSVGAMIAPGTMGTIGTLTFGGNGVLASATNLLIDVGPNGTSDRLAFVATTFNGTTPTNGIANVGGRVGFAAVAGSTIRSGDVYTILTAQGGVTGRFSAASPLSAILTPTFLYSANAVQARIDAGLYANVVANTPVQSAFARLLDQNRTNYAALSDVYGTLDLQNAATIRGTLETLAPRAETLKTALGITAIDNMSRFYRDHLAQMDTRGGLGGTLAMIGKPIELASLMASDLPGGQDTMSDSSGTTVREGALPEDMSAFLAGGYIDGRSRSMRTAVPFGGHDRFDGYYIAGGVEKQAGDGGVVGFSFSYTNTDGTTRGQAQKAEGDLYQGTLYGKLETATGLTLDTQFSAGAFVASTDRTVGIVGTTYRLRSKDNALTVVSEVGVSQMFDLADLKVGPRISVRAAHIGFGKAIEGTDGPALFIDRRSYDSLQGRAGLSLSGGTTIRPYAAANYVHDFQSTPGVFGANFVGGIGPNALFALAGQDRDWAEISAGLTLTTGAIDLSIGADSTVERKDVSNQSYKGSVKIHF